MSSSNSNSNDNSNANSNANNDEKCDLVGLTMKNPYEIGSCINLIYETFYARLLDNRIYVLNDKDQDIDVEPKFSDCVTKHRIMFYFFSTVTSVCLADGKLGSDEEEFIRSICSLWDVSEDSTNEALKGKDYTKEYLEACEKYWDELIPNLGKEDKAALMNGMKNDIVLYSVLAASQDGFVKQEYKQAQEVATKLGLDEACVKENVEIVEMEKALAARLLKRLKPSK